MDKNNKYTKLTTHFEKIHNLNSLLGLIHWDFEVNMQKKSAHVRQKEITTLSSITHELLISQHTADLLTDAECDLPVLDEWQKRNIYLIRKQLTHATCISTELEASHTEAVSQCVFMWREARQNNDFHSFKPYLHKVVSVTKEIAQIKSEKFGMAPYDILIDQYDPDRKSDEIKSVFNVLKSEIPKLLAQIQAKQEREKIISNPNTLSMDPIQQKLLGKKIMEYMGFDFDRGRLDESIHPFCGGATNDIRLTTRYNQADFLPGLLGVVHETGHALYEMDLPEDYINQLVGRSYGMTFHESQSLLMECQVAKSREFLTFLAKILQDECKLFGEEYFSENLYKKLSYVEPTLIRVEADEVTYPLHIILRFEIEEALINNDITVEDLPTVWNEKMKQYLGITPDSDKNGFMQDIHWPSGAIGYFPAYTNGAIVASMIMKKATEVYPLIRNSIKEGNFTELNSFARQNLRRFGSLKNSSDLLYTATGYNSIQPEVFIEYLREKYT
jgi:carboxypeptidase Taq